MNDYTKAMVEKLSITERTHFESEYSTRKKSILIAYICWILIGFHYLYLKNMGTQFFFWLTAGGVGVWWIIDCFRISRMVNDYNRILANSLIIESKNINK